jgi:hypothetical protein
MSSNLAIMIVTIVAIVMCANVMRSFFKQRDRRPDDQEYLGDTLEKIDLLEERIRVLERIITESRVDLKQEIDSL